MRHSDAGLSKTNISDRQEPKGKYYITFPDLRLFTLYYKNRLTNNLRTPINIFPSQENFAREGLIIDIIELVPNGILSIASFVGLFLAISVLLRFIRQFRQSSISANVYGIVVSVVCVLNLLIVQGMACFYS